MIKEKISQLVDDSAHSLGYTVYESSIIQKGENSRINVKIDSLSGISHLDCESYSRELAGRLDEEDILLNYSLEISSPGFKRLLRHVDEFKRFAGAPVKVIYEIDNERRVLKGAILNVSEEFIEFTSENGELKISFKHIIDAKLDY